MTDEQIVKALECCSSYQYDYCDKCDFKPKENIKGTVACCMELMCNTLDLITRQQAEIDNLNYTLLGIMHSVDKWLDGAELEQDEVSRAAAMREKTLQIIEEKQAEIERLKDKYEVCFQPKAMIKSEAIKEFAERLKEKKQNSTMDSRICTTEMIDNLVKEMVGDKE